MIRVRRNMMRTQWLTEEQISRAEALQKRMVASTQKIPSSSYIPMTEHMATSVSKGNMMKQTFEEKYANTNTRITKNEYVKPEVIEELEIVPPSLEEDPNQPSPLREDMLEQDYHSMTNKQLIELYKSKWGEKNLTQKNKEEIINEILNLWEKNDG